MDQQTQFGEALQRLEVSNRRLRTFLLMGVVLFAVLVVLTLTGRTDTPHKSRELVVVDQAGKDRIVLFAGPDGPGIKLLDENGTTRLALAALDQRGCGVSFFDDQFRLRAALNVDAAGPTLVMTNHEGTAVLGATVNDEEANFSIFGKDQQAYGRLVVGTNGLPALELFGENREPLFRAP